MTNPIKTYSTIIAIACSAVSYFFSSTEVKKTAARLEARTQSRILDLEYRLEHLISDIDFDEEK